MRVKGLYQVNEELERADMEEAVQKHSLDLSSFSPNLHRCFAYVQVIDSYFAGLRIHHWCLQWFQKETETS